MVEAPSYSIYRRSSTAGPTNVIPTVLLLGVILLNLFQDSAVQGLAGFWGANLAVFSAALLLGILLITWIYQRPRVPLVWLLIASYAATVTAGALISLPAEAHGTGLLFKAATNASGLILFLAIVVAVSRWSSQLTSYLGLIFALISIALSVVLAFEVAKGPDFAYPSFFHFTPNLNQRPRLFTLESSAAGILVINLVLLSIVFMRSVVSRLALALLLIADLMVIGSKGALVSAGVGFLLYAAIELLRRLSTRHVIKMAIIVLIVAISLVEVGVIEQLRESAAKETSVATRTTLAVSAVMATVEHPLGSGFSGYLYYFDEYIPRAISFLHSLGVQNFSEVAGYVSRSNDYALTTKTSFFDLLYWFGIPGAMVFTGINLALVWHLVGLRLSLSEENYKSSYFSLGLLAALLCINFVAQVAYVNAINLYELAITYGIAIFILRSTRSRFWSKDDARG